MGANPFAKAKAEDAREGPEKGKPDLEDAREAGRATPAKAKRTFAGREGKPELNRFGQVKKGTAPKGRYPRE